MITLRIHENNTGTIDFESEEQLEAWIDAPNYKQVQWEYTEEDVFHRTYFVERNTNSCLLYTSPSPRDLSTSRMPSSA